MIIGIVINWFMINGYLAVTRKCLHEPFNIFFYFDEKGEKNHSCRVQMASKNPF